MAITVGQGARSANNSRQGNVSEGGATSRNSHLDSENNVERRVETNGDDSTNKPSSLNLPSVQECINAAKPKLLAQLATLENTFRLSTENDSAEKSLAIISSLKTALKLADIETFEKCLTDLCIFFDLNITSKREVLVEELEKKIRGLDTKDISRLLEGYHERISSRTDLGLEGSKKLAARSSVAKDGTPANEHDEAGSQSQQPNSVDKSNWPKRADNSQETTGERLIPEGKLEKSKPGTIRGRAVIVGADLATLELGPEDVLICRTINPGELPLLAKCAGTVSEQVPQDRAAVQKFVNDSGQVCVIGAASAALRIENGDHIEISPNGTIRILGEWAEPPLSKFRCESCPVDELKKLLPSLPESTARNWRERYSDWEISPGQISTAAVFRHIMSAEMYHKFAPKLWKNLTPASADPDGYRVYLRCTPKGLASASFPPRSTAKELAQASASSRNRAEPDEPQIDEATVLQIVGQAEIMPERSASGEEIIDTKAFLEYLNSTGQEGTARCIQKNLCLLHQDTTRRIARDAGLINEAAQGDSQAVNIREFLYHLVIRGHLEAARNIARYFDLRVPQGDLWNSTITGNQLNRLCRITPGEKNRHIAALDNEREIDAFITGKGANHLYRLSDVVARMVRAGDFRYISAIAEAYNLTVPQLLGFSYERRPVDQVLVSRSEAVAACRIEESTVRQWEERWPDISRKDGQLHLASLLSHLAEDKQTKPLTALCSSLHVQLDAKSGTFERISPYDDLLDENTVFAASGSNPQAKDWGNRWPDIVEHGRWRISTLLARLSHARKHNEVKTICASLDIQRIAPYAYISKPLEELSNSSEEIAGIPGIRAEKVDSWLRQWPEIVRDGQCQIVPLLQHLYAAGDRESLQTLCNYFDIRCIQNEYEREVSATVSEIALVSGAGRTTVNYWRERATITLPLREGEKLRSTKQRVDIGLLINSILYPKIGEGTRKEERPIGDRDLVGRLREAFGWRQRTILLQASPALSEVYPQPKSPAPPADAALQAIRQYRVSATCNPGFNTKAVPANSLKFLSPEILAKHRHTLNRGTVKDRHVTRFEISIAEEPSGKEIAVGIFELKGGRAVEIVAYETPAGSAGGVHLSNLLRIVDNLFEGRITEIITSFAKDDYAKGVQEVENVLTQLNFSAAPATASPRAGEGRITATFRRAAEPQPNHTAAAPLPARSPAAALSPDQVLEQFTGSLQELANVCNIADPEKLRQLAARANAIYRDQVSIATFLRHYIPLGWTAKHADRICDYYGIGYLPQVWPREIQFSCDRLKTMLGLDDVVFARQIANRDDIWVPGQEQQIIDIGALLASFEKSPPADPSLPADVRNRCGWRRYWLEIPSGAGLRLNQRYPNPDADVFREVSQHRVDNNYTPIPDEDFFRRPTVSSKLPVNFKPFYDVRAKGGTLNNATPARQKPRRLEIVIYEFRTFKEAAVLIVEAQPPGTNLKSATSFKLVAAEVRPSEQGVYNHLEALLKVLDSITGGKVKEIEVSLSRDNYRTGAVAARKEGLDQGRNPRQFATKVAEQSIIGKQLAELDFAVLPASVKPELAIGRVEATFTRNTGRWIQRRPSETPLATPALRFKASGKPQAVSPQPGTEPATEELRFPARPADQPAIGMTPAATPAEQMLRLPPAPSHLQKQEEKKD